MEGPNKAERKKQNKAKQWSSGSETCARFREALAQLRQEEEGQAGGEEDQEDEGHAQPIPLQIREALEKAKDEENADSQNEWQMIHPGLECPEKPERRSVGKMDERKHRSVTAVHDTLVIATDGSQVTDPEEAKKQAAAYAVAAARSPKDVREGIPGVVEMWSAAIPGKIGNAKASSYSCETVGMLSALLNVQKKPKGNLVTDALSLVERMTAQAETGRSAARKSKFRPFESRLEVQAKQLREACRAPPVEVLTGDPPWPKTDKSVTHRNALGQLDLTWMKAHQADDQNPENAEGLPNRTATMMNRKTDNKANNTAKVALSLPPDKNIRHPQDPSRFRLVYKNESIITQVGKAVMTVGANQAVEKLISLPSQGIVTRIIGDDKCMQRWMHMRVVWYAQKLAEKEGSDDSGLDIAQYHGWPGAIKKARIGTAASWVNSLRLSQRPGRQARTTEGSRTAWRELRTSRYAPFSSLKGATRPI